MNIYRYQSVLSTAAGATSATTLNINGGLLRQVLVRALTSSLAQFQVSIAESGGITILNYGYHTGELNDTGATGALPLPVLGYYTVSITNASPNDTFAIRCLVQE